MVRILSFGCQREFLRLRHQALEKAGLDVTSAATRDEAERFLRTKSFHVLLIGHAVPVKERVEVALMAKSLQKIPVICLYHGSINQAESADAILSIEGSSDDLVAAIHRLVKDPDSAAPLSRSAV
jgi:DNA-binding response OmpR family regulator